LRGEEPGAVGMQFNVIENGRRVAEDEINPAFDIRVHVVLPPVIGEERVLMAEEAAVLEDRAVAAVSDSNCLTGIACSVLERDVIGFKSGAVDLYRLGEKGATRLLCVERVGNDDIFRRFAHPDERNVWMILGDDDSFVIDAGSDMDENATGGAVRVRCSKRMMIERHLDGGKIGCAIDVAFACRRDGDVDISCMGSDREGEQKW